MKRMTITSLLLFTVLSLFSAAMPLWADTPNYSTAIPGVVVIPLHFDGQFTVTTNPVAKFKLPFAAQLIGVSANARASGGTTPTLTVDVQDDGTSTLSAAISITAGTVAEGTISNATIADESVMSVILTIGGTNPTWDDITLLLTLVRI